jgi:hypothetical protein
MSSHVSKNKSVEELLIIYTNTDNQLIKEQCMYRCQKTIVNFVKHLFNNWVEPNDEDFNVVLIAVLSIFEKYNISSELFVETQTKIISVYQNRFINIK